MPKRTLALFPVPLRLTLWFAVNVHRTKIPSDVDPHWARRFFCRDDFSHSVNGPREPPNDHDFAIVCHVLAPQCSAAGICDLQMPPAGEAWLLKLNKATLDKTADWRQDFTATHRAPMRVVALDAAQHLILRGGDRFHALPPE